MHGKFEGQSDSELSIKGLKESFFPIVVVSSDGRDFNVNFCSGVIPILNAECIKRTLECVTDAFYRVRPDLRTQ